MASSTSYTPGWEQWAQDNPRAHNLYANKPSAWQRARQSTAEAMGAGGLRAKVSGFNARVGSSYLGRSAQIGAKEAMGWSYHGDMFGPNATSEGFLGWKKGLNEAGISSNQISKVYGKARGMGASKFSSTRMAVAHGYRKAGATGIKKMIGAAAPGAFGLIATAYMAVTGYQEGGTAGAAGGIVSSQMYGAALRMGGGAIFNPVTIAGAVVAGAGYGIYKAGEAGQAYEKKLRTIEMGGGAGMEAIGSMPASTMRQRSALALQNSHINGRTALGNEALLFHSQF